MDKRNSTVKGKSGNVLATLALNPRCCFFSFSFTIKKVMLYYSAL